MRHPKIFVTVESCLFWGPSAAHALQLVGLPNAPLLLPRPLHGMPALRAPRIGQVRSLLPR